MAASTLRSAITSYFATQDNEPSPYLRGTHL
jgi:hypothetical protein